MLKGDTPITKRVLGKYRANLVITHATDASSLNHPDIVSTV